MLPLESPAFLILSGKAAVDKSLVIATYALVHSTSNKGRGGNHTKDISSEVSDHLE